MSIYFWHYSCRITTDDTADAAVYSPITISNAWVKVTTLTSYSLSCLVVHTTKSCDVHSHGQVFGQKTRDLSALEPPLTQCHLCLMYSTGEPIHVGDSHGGFANLYGPNANRCGPNANPCELNQRQWWNMVCVGYARVGFALCMLISFLSL